MYASMARMPLNISMNMTYRQLYQIMTCPRWMDSPSSGRSENDTLASLNNMLTENDSKEVAIEALKAGADFYQNKTKTLEIQ
jgi:hypothetical protein